MVDVGMLLLWILTCTKYTFGLEAIGFSALLSEEILFDVPTTHDGGASANIVTGWAIQQEYGLYNHDSYKKKTGQGREGGHVIVAPLEGVYFLSANIAIASSKNTTLEAYFHDVTSQTQQKYCTAVENLTPGLITVTLSCFTRLKFLTELNLIVRNIHERVTVKPGSSVSVKFIGASGVVPSLVLPLIDTGDLYQEGKNYNNGGDFGYFNALAVIHERNRITVPCDGTYVVSLSSFGKINHGSSLHVTINGHIVYSLPKLRDVHSEGALWKKHFLEVFHLQRNDEIRVNYTNIELDYRSSYAVIRTWDNNRQDSGSISIPLKEPAEFSNGLMFPLSPVMSSVNRLPFSTNTSKFQSKSQEFLTVNSYGLCLVSLDLEIYGNGTEKLDFDIIVRVSQETDFLDTDTTTGLNSQIKSVLNKARTLKIVGVLELHSDSYLSIAVVSRNAFPFTVKEKVKGRLVITQIQLNTLVAAMSLSAPPTTTNIACNKNNMLVYSVTSSRNFFLDKYISPNDASFTAPDSAVYLVHIYGTLQLIREDIVNYTVYIQQQRKNKIISDIKEFVFPPDQVLIVRLIAMEKGDLVRVMTSCEKNVRLIDSLKVSFIIVQRLPSSNYVIDSPLYKVSPNLADRQQANHVIKQPGVYFMVFRVLLKVKNLARGTTIEIRVNKGAVNLLNEEKRFSLDVIDIQINGLVTVNVFGFLHFDKNDEVQTEIISTTVDNEGIDSNNKDGQLTVRVVEETLEYIRITDQTRATHGFRAVQLSMKLFNFANKFTTPDNFQLTSSVGGFQLKQTQLFGPHFIAPKPMTVLYVTSVRLVDVSGTFQLSIHIRPRRGMVQITAPIKVKAKQTITLKASGLLKLSEGGSVEFVVNGETSNHLVLCKNSLWSLIEITTPIPQFYGTVSRNNSEKRQKTEHNVGTSLFLSRSSNVGNFSNSLQFTESSDNLKIAAQEFYTIKTAEPVQSVNILSPEQQQNGSFVDMKLNMLTSNSSNSSLTGCDVVLLETRKQRIGELRFASNNTIMDLDTKEQDMLLLCLKKDDNLSFRSMKKPVNTSSTQENNLTSPLYTTLASTIEAFSAILRETQDMVLVKNRPERVNGWVASNNPPFFDQSQGFRERKGMYVVSINGFHLVMVKLRTNLDDDDMKSCSMFIRLDDNEIKVSVPMARQTVHNDVIWLQQDSVLQLMISCHSDITVRLEPSSTFSIMQTDTRVSLSTECLQSDLLLSVDEEIAFTQVSTPYNVTCHHSQYLIGDFEWKKNGKIILTSFGQREATVQFPLLTMEDNGKYECVMERGKHETYSKKVEIVVIDPRPKLKLSSISISIEENTILNPMVAWAQVRAYNLSTNTMAQVRLSIVEGDPENLFYFTPEVAMFVSSLKFKKPLDYELQQSYALTIQAENTEFNGPLGVVQQQLRVKVIDRNEHRPRFNSVVKTISIAENIKVDTMISTFSATDLDLTSTTNLSYSLMKTPNSKLFRIDQSTGELFVANAIDYELVQEVYLIVIVSDGVHTTYTDVKILVQNANDNQPRFTQEKYNVNITDSQQPGYQILSLKALDKDTTKNENVILYRIVSGNRQGYFAMSSNSLVAVTIPNAGESFMLTIAAYDNDRKASTNNATVSIQVTKSQSRKQPPPFSRIFKKMFYSIDLYENTAIDSIVFKPELANRPSEPTFLIEYRLKEFGGEGRYFRIASNGTLFVANLIDYEKNKNFYLAISACAKTALKTKTKEEESSCDLCHVTINILDINDNPPKLEKEQFTYDISVDRKPKSVIATLHAEDADENKEGGFSFYIHPPIEEFSIGIKSGELSLERQLNHTMQAKYEFSVEVRDGGSPSLVGSCTVVINVLQNNTAAAPRRSSLGGGSDLLPYLHWKYTIPVSLAILIIFLVIAILLLVYKFNRSTKELTECKLAEPRTEMKSLLMYFKQPGESMEATMKFSCESIPAAYDANGNATNLQSHV